MTDIKFKFKTKEKIISESTSSNQSNSKIYSKVLEVLKHPYIKEDVVGMVNNDKDFLLLLETFKWINNNLNVSNIEIEFIPHGRFISSNKALNFDYNFTIYSQTLNAVGQDFKSLDKNNIRTACYIEKQQEIFILEFDLANDNKTTMVSL